MIIDRAHDTIALCMCLEAGHFAFSRASPRTPPLEADCRRYTTFVYLTVAGLVGDTPVLRDAGKPVGFVGVCMP